MGQISGASSGIHHPGPIPLGTSMVVTDNTRCSAVRQQIPVSAEPQAHPNGLNIPQYFQIPPLHQPPPQLFEPQHVPPLPGIWPAKHASFSNNLIPPHYNPITGQFLPLPSSVQQQPQSHRAQQAEWDINDQIQQMDGVSFYADAVLKGPRLEIPFTRDDPIGWLQQCENFFDMSGTPFEQWVNIATGHFCGRANVWLQNICIPWQMINWQQFCQMIADRFTQANANEAVEMLKNIQLTASVQSYIDKFEECVQLVKRDHPYLQEPFLMSCFIGGLRAYIKHDVSGQRPRGMLEAYWYAKVYENSATTKNYITRMCLPNQNKTSNLNIPPNLHHLLIRTELLLYQTIRIGLLDSVGIVKNYGTENTDVGRAAPCILWRR